MGKIVSNWLGDGWTRKGMPGSKSPSEEERPGVIKKTAHATFHVQR